MYLWGDFKPNFISYYFNNLLLDIEQVIINQFYNYNYTLRSDNFYYLIIILLSYMIEAEYMHLKPII